MGEDTGTEAHWNNKQLSSAGTEGIPHSRLLPFSANQTQFLQSFEKKTNFFL